LVTGITASCSEVKIRGTFSGPRSMIEIPSSV
jgi:hypothetical protein